MYTVGASLVDDIHGVLFAGHGGGDGRGDLRGPEIQAVRPCDAFVTVTSAVRSIEMDAPDAWEFPACVLTSCDAQDELRGAKDGASARRVAAAAVEPVEEVVDVGEGSDRLHPPFERAEHQELHPLDRLRLEHVPRVADLLADRIQCNNSDQEQGFRPGKWASACICIALHLTCRSRDGGT